MTREVKQCPVLAKPFLAFDPIQGWYLEKQRASRSQVRTRRGHRILGIPHVFEHVPKCHYVELTFFPKAGSQPARAHVKTKLNAKRIRQSAAVLDRFHFPACAVGSVEEVSGAAADLQQLASVAVAL